MVNDDETCSCDMRHPDDDSPFEHHERCVGRHRDASWWPDEDGLRPGVDYEVAVCPVCGTACDFPPECADQLGTWPQDGGWVGPSSLDDGR